MEENWKAWGKEYGDLFYLRATGQLPAMDSSKAATKIITSFAEENTTILDVGCGGGHYLPSLDAALKVRFNYLGIDATPYYIELAKKAFFGKDTNPLRIKTDFRVGDIFNLPLEENAADITMCNHVLLHLPSIETPLKELWRVTKKYLLIRTLIGKVSFRIKQINSPEEYLENGEPVNFHYFNIYSEDYIRDLIRGLNGVKEFSITEDKDFDPQNLGNASNYAHHTAPHDLTTVISGMQVNNYIIQPWHFLLMEKKQI